MNASLISSPDIESLFLRLAPFLFLFFFLSSIGPLGGSLCASADDHHAQTKQRYDKEERCKFQKLAVAGSYSDHDLCFPFNVSFLKLRQRGMFELFLSSGSILAGLASARLHRFFPKTSRTFLPMESRVRAHAYHSPSKL